MSNELNNKNIYNSHNTKIFNNVKNSCDAKHDKLLNLNSPSGDSQYEDCRSSNTPESLKNSKDNNINNYCSEVYQAKKTIKNDFSENINIQKSMSSDQSILENPKSKMIEEGCLPLSQSEKKNNLINCPHDLKVLCRLIAGHQKPPAKNIVVSLFVDSVSYKFYVRLSLDIGYNVRCLVYEYQQSNPLQQDRKRVSDIIFAFNWFSPSGIWDYVALGLKFLTDTGNIEEDFCMCNALSMSQALEFFNHPEMREFLYELKSGSLKNPENNKIKLIENITITGFSMGGSTSHAFSVLLKEIKNMPQKICCVGFGCPRPGNKRLKDWIDVNLTNDSINIILANLKSDGTLKYDPVTQTPSCISGFDIHPNLYIMLQRSGGYMRLITKKEAISLELEDDKLNTSSSITPISALMSITLRGSPFPPNVSTGFDELHSVLKYYEAMCGADI